MLISNATETVKAWQCRPLDRLYPIVYFAAIVALEMSASEHGSGRPVWHSDADRLGIKN